MTIHIYAADDDENIRTLMQIFLESEGYTVTLFENGDDLFSKFHKTPCDLVILDIMMPGTDGLTICHKLRNISNVPIIMLTAKDTDSDYITGITMGSDDYLTKPFRPTMLVVRVKALLRRISMEREQREIEIQSKKQEDISFGDLVYSDNSHAAFCGDVNLRLTATELNLLLYLLKHQDKAVSKDELLRNIWGQTAEIETRVTDETIRRIRKKMKNVNSKVLIRTVWGYGYKLDVMEE